MATDANEWPSTSWELTAPESYVLQAPGSPSGIEAFKLALRELVLRRVLRVEELESGGLFGRRRRKSVLRAGTATTTEPALAPLLELHRELTRKHGSDGVPVEDFAGAARRGFGRTFAGYVNEHVYPSLARRGLLGTEESKRLGLVTRRRHTLTPEGRQASEQLERWLRTGQERLEGWVRESPERALGYAGGAGAAILLMDDGLYPALEQLEGHGHQFHFGAFGGHTGGDFSGIDSGFDAGGGFGGDGGGGGGGGDGGGGGG